MNAARIRTFGRVIAAVAFAVAVAGCGVNNDVKGTGVTVGRDGTTVVTMTVTEMKFVPSHIEVPAGSTVTFNIRNTGIAPHDVIIGDRDVQSARDREVVANGPTAPHNGPEQVLYLNPGESGTLTWTAPVSAERTFIGCHQAGHWLAGMQTELDVV